ncbi:MAG: M48 family metalloprotease [Gaiellaceae bacterium]
MSERTAIRMGQVLTLAVVAAAWGVAAWLLTRTSVPSLHLAGFDQHRFFDDRALRRSARYSHGEQALWAAGTAASLAALAVLAWRLPRSIRGMGLGRIGSAIVAGMVLLVTLWAVSLPFGLAGLWWQHRWGLGPFDVAAWLDSQWAGLASEAVAVMGGIVLLVGLAGRFRRWWLIVGPVIVAIAAAFAFVGGYLAQASAHPLRNPALAAEARHLERIEGVAGTPVGVQDVSSWTNQVNAFTSGFGPSTSVVVWNTLLDGRFSRGEQRVVIAHELGHVRSRHILKAIGWTGLLVLPTLWLVALATRRRGGLGRAENVPLAILVLAVLALVTTPIQNAVSRRYEAEADWRALNATRDPVAARELFRGFERTSLQQPDPAGWDYIWLENHPTLMQRIAMAERWRELNK